MLVVEKQYVLDWPLEDTVRFITNPLSDLKWMSSCVDVDLHTPDTYDVTFKFFGKKLKFGIKTNSDGYTMHQYQTTSGPLFFTGSYRFSALASGTRIDWKFEADPGKFFGLVPHGILRKALDKQADNDITVLTQLMLAARPETEASPS